MSTVTTLTPEEVRAWARDWLGGDVFECPYCKSDASIQCNDKDDEGSSCVEQWSCSCGGNFSIEKCDMAVAIRAHDENDDDEQEDGVWITASELATTNREDQLANALRACVDFIENVTDEDPERTAKFFAVREQWRDAFDALPKLVAV
jgi:hypothetical protein